jgi:hypothetical protein
MGIFSKGLFGAFRGKVGSIVGSTWKGVEVVRSKPAARKGNFSADQLQQQAKFSLMIKFLRPLSPLLNQAYGATAVQMTGINKAFAYNIMNAVAGVYPAFTINYPKIQLGQGNLTEAELPAASSAAAGKLSINWTDNSGNGSAQAADIAFIAIYCEDLNRWFYKQNAAARSDGAVALDVPAFSGKKVQTYLGFVSAKGKQVSTGLFAGEVSVL